MAKKTRIEILADWLEKQAMDSSITDGRIWQEMALSERTFYRLKPEATALAHRRAEMRQKEMERANIQGAHEAAKMGIKTRNDRILLLQEEILKCKQELDSDIVTEIVKIGNQVKKVNRTMDVYEKVALRKTIKELQSEISKIEGDYAPTKQEVNISGYDVIIPGEQEADD